MFEKASHLRTGRVSETGRIYLISTATIRRQTFFSDWQLGRLVVAELRSQEHRGCARSIAWVLMPDHLHWLVQLHDGDISALVLRVKCLSAQSINRALGTRGAVWQRGFHDRAIRREQDLQAIARYIVRNPIRAGLVERVGDYPLWDACWI
ncbi:transposase [Pseudomonas sp. HR96]|uniref:REP-associated tyrosine transposase n=1 Tax=Pseudomonas sp. HR96 TaxID=1027966 RepID=UPI002A75FFC6|nr:transposase [Pseudomonas sp. HR96]WPO98031.1 transposase [Pseudomonas sp. HR96]